MFSRFIRLFRARPRPVIRNIEAAIMGKKGRGGHGIRFIKLALADGNGCLLSFNPDQKSLRVVYGAYENLNYTNHTTGVARITSRNYPRFRDQIPAEVRMLLEGPYDEGLRRIMQFHKQVLEKNGYDQEIWDLIYEPFYHPLMGWEEFKGKIKRWRR